MRASLACIVALAVGAAGSCSSTGGSPVHPIEGDGGIAADAPRCTLPPAATTSVYALRYDQVGYLPEGQKWALVLGAGAAAPKFTVLDLATGCLVGSGVAGPRVVDTTSRAGTPLTGDKVDLSMLANPGRYVVVLEDGAQFGPVVVDANAYADAMPKLLRFFGVQRCGPTTAAVSQHGPCHLNASLTSASSGDGVIVDDGYTGSVQLSTGPAANVEGGWHDAGDYIKFVGTTSFTLAVDLLALRDHSAAFKGPRAGASFEALRAEMRWGLDWLVRMLGGSEMLHQVSGAKDHDPGWRTPESDTLAPIPGYTQRPAFRFAAGSGGNLLGRSVAALALGSQVFSDDPTYAASLLALAKSTFAAGEPLTTAQSPDPPDFYPEQTVDDDLAFGAAALARATGDTSFAASALTHARAITVSTGASPLAWGDVTAMALLETARAYPSGSAERTEMTARLASLAAPFLAKHTGGAAAYGYALDTLGNGSLEESLGAASACLASTRLGGSAACVELARTQLHWLFGQNPFGLSFMVGMGTSSPANLHHSYAQATHSILAGAIVGGPTSMSVLRASHASDASLLLPRATSAYASWSTEDVVYDDEVSDYVVNEPAIDFTAPMVFVLGELLDPG